MRFLLLLPLLLLTSCGPNVASSRPWISATPISITVDSSVPAVYDRDVISATAIARLRQFDLVVDNAAPSARQIVVDWSSCTCAGCDRFSSYVVNTDYTRIHLCSSLATLCDWVGYPRSLQMTIGHELCHVLGLDGHAGLGFGDLCSASTSEHDNVDTYTINDIDKVCAAGGVATVACER